MKGATFVKMGIVEKFIEYVQRHIKKKVKKELVETHLFDVDKIIGNQANPLDLEFGMPS